MHPMTHEPSSTDSGDNPPPLPPLQPQPMATTSPPQGRGLGRDSGKNPGRLWGKLLLGAGMSFLLIGLFVSVMVNLVFLARTGGEVGLRGAPILTHEGLERVVVEPRAGREHGYIAVIPIEGVIRSDEGGEIGQSMVDDAKIAIREAREDDRVVAVVLSMNSPGGEVTASDILHREVVELAESKPVVVSMGSVAASGAYYIACAADYIIANETTFTGSIGVIMNSLNYEGLLGKVGLSPLVFKSGKLKDMLSGSRQATPEEMEYVQGMVGQVYDKFLGIVAEARDLPPEELRRGAADGRILTGKDARAAGLVDGLGYAEDAYDKARELANDPGAGVIRYRPETSFRSFMRQLGARAEPKVELNLGVGNGFVPKSGVAYYLPEIYGW